MAAQNDIEWANTYYEEPDVVRYAGLIHLLARNSRKMHDGEHTGRLLGAAMRGQPDRVHEAWKVHLQHIPHPEFQRMLIFALWYSGTEQARAVLQRLATNRKGSALMRLKARAMLQGAVPVPALEKPLVGEDVIEELWDNFLMLGDKAYLERMGVAAAYRSPEKVAEDYKSALAQNEVEIDQAAAHHAAYKMFTMSYNHKPMAEVFQGMYMRARDPDAPPRAPPTDGRQVLRGTATVAEDVPGLTTAS